jgi:hypothetical protein
MYVTIWIAPKRPGTQKVWVADFVQGYRRIIRTDREADELSHEQTLLNGVYDVVSWTHLLERLATRRIDPRKVVHHSTMTEFAEMVAGMNPLPNRVDFSTNSHQLLHVEG